MEHILYQKGDDNVPDSIQDRNGDITLGLCKICGRGEADLSNDSGACPGATVKELFPIDCRTLPGSLHGTSMGRDGEPSMTDIQADVHEWANQTFPGRAPAAGWLKLFEELGEVIKTPRDKLEWADVFIMLFDLASMYEVNVESAIEAKLAINRNRSWQQTESGVYTHVHVGQNPGVVTPLVLSCFDDGPWNGTARQAEYPQSFTPNEDGTGGCYNKQGPARLAGEHNGQPVVQQKYIWREDGVPF